MSDTTMALIAVAVFAAGIGSFIAAFIVGDWRLLIVTLIALGLVARATAA